MIVGFDYERDARAELEEQAAFYEVRRGGLGERYLAAVQRAIERAMTTPHAGSPLTTPFSKELGLRRRRVFGFPASIVYAIRGDRLLVVAVAHSKRRPDYWRGRIKR